MTRALPLLLALAGCADVAAEDVLVVINISPSGGAANVATTVAPRVTFNHELDESTVTSANFKLQDVDSNDIELEVSWDSLTYTAEMMPVAELAEDASYTLVVTENVDSEVGMLGVDIFSTFTTAGALSTNTLPEANAGEDQTVPPGELVTLDGSGSSDADGDALTYSWTFEYGPTESVTLDASEPVSPTFTPADAGKYIFSLTVNDGTEDSSKDYVAIVAGGGGPPEDDPPPSDTEPPPEDDPPPSDTERPPEDDPPPSDTERPPEDDPPEDRPPPSDTEAPSDTDAP